MDALFDSKPLQSLSAKFKTTEVILNKFSKNAALELLLKTSNFTHKQHKIFWRISHIKFPPYIINQFFPRPKPF